MAIPCLEDDLYHGSLTGLEVNEESNLLAIDPSTEIVGLSAGESRL